MIGILALLAVLAAPGGQDEPLVFGVEVALRGRKGDVLARPAYYRPAPGPR